MQWHLVHGADTSQSRDVVMMAGCAFMFMDIIDLMSSVGIVWLMRVPSSAIWSRVCFIELYSEPCRNWCDHVKLCVHCSLLYSLPYGYLWSYGQGFIFLCVCSRSFQQNQSTSYDHNTWLANTQLANRLHTFAYIVEGMLREASSRMMVQCDCVMYPKGNCGAKNNHGAIHAVRTWVIAAVVL